MGYWQPADSDRLARRVHSVVGISQTGQTSQQQQADQADGDDDDASFVHARRVEIADVSAGCAPAA